MFGGAEVYRLPPAGATRPTALRDGRTLFGTESQHDTLAAALEDGSSLRTTVLSHSFTFADYKSHYGPRATPLFLVTDGGRLAFFTADSRPTPKPGTCVVSLVRPENGNGQS